MMAIVRKLVIVGLPTIIVVGLIGQITRDRSAPLAVLMYLPLLPAGLAALVLDLIRSGRALPRGRFILSWLGGVACIVAAIPMIAWGTPDRSPDNGSELSLLHWNVQWGGGIFKSPNTWAAQRAEILSRKPDLVVLSEGPSSDWIEQLVRELGPGADWVGIEHDPASRYWFKLAVCCRWPIQLEGRVPLPNGSGMSVIAEVRGRPLRLLVVDGLSNPRRSRLPFLHAIAEVCQTATESGRPFDAIVGDFNTPSQSIGFDALSAQGYTLAGRSARGWRATFPSFLPLYDIDHVWFAPGIDVQSCTLFNGPWTDHRGQLVRFQKLSK
jgi:endonuclease/exonuclease/phosphatase family metal-dependent hydrolase